MKVSPSQRNYNPNNKQSQNVSFSGAPKFKVANYLAKHPEVGEGTSITLDFIGKALVAPTFILFNPISKEPEDKKEYAALKNPIAAVIQLSMEAPIFMVGSKAIEKMANSWKGSQFNVKEATQIGEQAAKLAKSRLGILQSRSCFAMSLVLTPFMCQLENYLHPRLMKVVDSVQAKHAAQKAQPQTPSPKQNASTKEVK